MSLGSSACEPHHQNNQKVVTETVSQSAQIVEHRLVASGFAQAVHLVNNEEQLHSRQPPLGFPTLVGRV